MRTSFAALEPHAARTAHSACRPVVCFIQACAAHTVSTAARLPRPCARHPSGARRSATRFRRLPFLPRKALPTETAPRAIWPGIGPGGRLRRRRSHRPAPGAEHLRVASMQHWGARAPGPYSSVYGRIDSPEEVPHCATSPTHAHWQDTSRGRTRRSAATPGPAPASSWSLNAW